MEMMVQYVSSLNSTAFVVRRHLKCGKAGDKASMRFEDLVKKAVLPVSFLRKLFSSSTHEGKLAIIDSLSTSFEAHMKLAEDEHLDVRYALAENHNVSRAVLNKLKSDTNPYVAHRAAKTLERIQLNDTEFLSWRACPSG